MPLAKNYESSPFGRQYGFSLIELIAVITIVSMILVVAADGYSSWLLRTKSEELVDNIKRSLIYTKSAAIERGGNVRICGSDGGVMCTGSFSNGWIVFKDSNGSQQFDENDTLIRVFNHRSTVFDIALTNVIGSSAVDGLTFDYKGYSDSSIEFTLNHADLDQRFIMTTTGYFQ